MGRADLRGATLQQCDFKGAVLERVVAEGLSFAGCRLEDARFLESDLAGVRFDGAPAARARFTQCRFAGASFAGADLSQVDFSECTFPETDFRGATLERCSFSEYQGGAALSAPPAPATSGS